MRIFAIVLSVVLMASAAMAQSQQPGSVTVKGDAAAWQEVSTAWERVGRLKSYRMRLVPAPGQEGADKMTMIMEFVNPDRTRMVMDMEDMMTFETIRVGEEFRRRITLKGSSARAAAASPAAGNQITNQLMSGGLFGFVSNIVSAVTNPIGFVANLAVSWIASRIAERAASSAGGAADDLRPGVWSCKKPTAGASASAQSGTSSATEVTAVRSGEVTIDGARTQGYDVTFVGGSGGGAWTSRMRVYVLPDRQVPRRIEMLDSAGRPQGSFDYYDFDAPITIELPACG